MLGTVFLNVQAIIKSTLQWMLDSYGKKYFEIFANSVLARNTLLQTVLTVCGFFYLALFKLYPALDYLYLYL